MVCLDPRGTSGMIYKENNITLLHTVFKSCRAHGFGGKDVCLFVCFPLYVHVYMGANVSQGGATLNPKSIIVRIYVKHHITLLHTKYTSFK